jgi:hypothetical protein
VLGLVLGVSSAALAQGGNGPVTINMAPALQSAQDSFIAQVQQFMPFISTITLLMVGVMFFFWLIKRAFSGGG